MPCNFQCFHSGPRSRRTFSKQHALPVGYRTFCRTVLMAYPLQDSAADYVARVKRDLGLAEVGIAQVFMDLS